MKTMVYSATSLDGYIARENGDLSWLENIPNPENSDFGFNEFMNTIDAIVMGRVTFEKVLRFNTWIYTKPVYVLSTTLQEIPPHCAGKAFLISGAPKQILETLRQKNYSTVYIDGGKTIQAFLADNMIDEMILTQIPILLGNGIPLFCKSQNEIEFEHIKTDVYKNGLVKSHYRKVAR